MYVPLSTLAEPANMENLPLEIHLEIFSRLPIISFLQIKIVCKAWHVLSKHPRLLTMFSERARNRNPSLILQYCDNSPTENNLCYVSAVVEDSNHHEYYCNKVLRVVPPFISNMPRYQVVGSCNGLLCISDTLNLHPIYICNIFTGDYIECPEVLDQEVVLGFGNHPTTKEYKVLRAVYYHNSDPLFGILYQGFEAQIFTVGTEGWRSLGSINWRLDLRPAEAVVNGAIHWVSVRDLLWRRSKVCIVAFDLAEEKFKEIDRPMCGKLSLLNFHLVNLRGCLSAVVRASGDGRIEIWVMKEYNVKESWTRDYAITTNIPASLSRRDNQMLKMWKIKTMSKQQIGVEVVCMLKNGDILLNYDEGGFILYSAHNESFKELVFSFIPKWFYAITHVETLFSVEQVLRM